MEACFGARGVVLATTPGGVPIYDRLGRTKVGVIPGYPLYPVGRLSDTTVFFKTL